MALQAIWVHGNSVCPQKTDPTNLKDFSGVKWSALLGLPQGNGITFRGVRDTNNWFHFCIPTPCYRDDNPNAPGGESRARLQRVFVLFSTDRGASLSAVHVWDGRNQYSLTPGDFSIGGNHSEIDNSNNWEVKSDGVNPEVFYGIGISVQISFVEEGNVTFVSAGANFLV